MVEAVDVKAVVTRLRNLARDPEHQPYIARRGVLPSLLNFLDTPSMDVKIMAAEALRFLGSHPDNRQLMAQEPRLVDVVCKVFNECKLSDVVLRELLADLLMYLGDYLAPEQTKSLTISLTQVLALSKQQTQEKTPEKQPLRTKHDKSSPILGNKRNVVLKIAALCSEDARQNMQKLVLSIRGTISFRINVQQTTLTLYTRTTTDRLLEILERGGFRGITVVLDKEMESNTQGQQVQSGSGCDKENRAPDSPKYLQKSPDRKEESQYKQSLALTNQGGDTLEARIARQRNLNDKKKKEQSAVSGFINKLSTMWSW